MFVWVMKMPHNIKQLDIKNLPCYFFSDMINIKNSNPNLLKITKLSFRGIFGVDICYIKYVTMKILDHVNINNKNFLCLNIVDGYNEESNRIKYLVFASTYKNKEALEKYTRLCNETKNQIKAINVGEPIKYRKNFMSIRFESDDLPLGKTLNIPSMIIVPASVFEKDGKDYPQVCLQECLYEL